MSELNFFGSGYFTFCSNNILFNIFKLVGLNDKINFANVCSRNLKLFMRIKINDFVVINQKDYKEIDKYPNIRFICDAVGKSCDYDDLIKIKNAYSISISENNKLTHVNCLKNVYELDLFHCSLSDIRGN